MNDRIKKNSILLGLVTIVFLYGCSQSKMNEEISNSINKQTDAILSVSKEQLGNYINSIPEVNLNDYGFKNKEEFNRIRFDEPINVYFLEGSKIVFTNTWRVPLIIDGEYRSLLTVARNNDEYKVVDFGAIQLAQIIFKKKTTKTIGLLRVYELKTDFLMEEISIDDYSFIQINAEGQELNLNDILNLIKRNN